MAESAPFYTECADAPAGAEAVWLTTSDGVRLRVALWGASDGALVLVFPGRTEVIEKYGRVVRDLTAEGFRVAVIDWRGQGLSDRLIADPLLGHVDSFADYQSDVAALIDWLHTRLPGTEHYLLAHSMGGCIGLRALMNGLAVRAAAFSAPMWGLSLPGVTRRAVAAAGSVLRLTGLNTRQAPGTGVEFRLWENPFDNNELTGDLEHYTWMQAQVQSQINLRLGAPTMGWLVAALAETRALAALPSPSIPTYCGLGSREKVVDTDAITTRLAKWEKGHLAQFDGALHELMMETPAHRDRFIAEVCAHFQARST